MSQIDSLPKNVVETGYARKTWVSALVPTKFYKSQNQFLPSDNVPPLEADASLLELSNKGRASVPIKNLEAWEKKARIAISSHADLFSSAACLPVPSARVDVGYGPFQVIGGHSQVDQARYSYVHYSYN